jgi:hypothetical protein
MDVPKTILERYRYTSLLGHTRAYINVEECFFNTYDKITSFPLNLRKSRARNMDFH